MLSHVPFATSWTAVHQASLSMGFSRQENWSGLPFPSLGDFPDPGIEHRPLASPAFVGRLFTTASPEKSPNFDPWTYMMASLWQPTCDSPSLCSVTQSYLTFCGPMTVACQASLSMAFSSQEYWSGLPFPFPGDLSDPGTEPKSLVSLALAAGFFTSSTIWEAQKSYFQSGSND